MVLGTEDATPVTFWFAVSPGASVQMDDLITVQTRKPDGSLVHFYGTVDHVRTRHEGVSFDSDVADVVAGLLPASVSYAARVLVTRVDPEDFIPPSPATRCGTPGVRTCGWPSAPTRWTIPFREGSSPTVRCCP